MKMKSILPSYYGGKATLAPIVMSYFPPRSEIYVEPFCGSAAVFFAARGKIAPIEILNDINGNLINLFHVLRDHSAALYKQLLLTPYSRREYNECWENLQAGKFKNKIHQAACFYVVTIQSFSNCAKFNSWAMSITTDKSAQWNNKIEIYRMDKIIQRLREASLENYPALKILRLYDKPRTMFYLDPPYLSVSDKKSMHIAYHQNSMSEDEHTELLAACLKLNGFCLISGYDHPVYDVLTKNGWEKKLIPHQTLINSRPTLKSNKRTEVLWLNPKLAHEQMNGRLF